MKSTKRLALNRSVITDLAADEMQVIAGANSGTTCPCVTTVHRECPSDPIMGCTVVQVTRYASCIC